MHYLELALAIIMELIGTNLMKLSNGFTHLCFSLGTLISYGLCFFFLSLSLKDIKLNIAYATWGGAGIVLAAFSFTLPISWANFGVTNFWNHFDRHRSRHYHPCRWSLISIIRISQSTRLYYLETWYFLLSLVLGLAKFWPGTNDSRQ